MGFIAMIWEWIKGLFKKPNKQVELVWSGMDVLPDGGSQALGVGLKSKAGPMDGSVGMQPVPASKGVKMVVDVSKATSFLNITLYQYINGAWVAGWNPTLDLSGKFRAELDLSPFLFGPNTELFAWIGYPPINTGPANIQVSVFVERT